MHEAVAVSAIGLIGSMALILVLAAASAGLLYWLDNRIEKGEEH